MLTRLPLAAYYSKVGREDEARVEIASVLKLTPYYSLELFLKTIPYRNQADLDRYLNALARAGLK